MKRLVALTAMLGATLDVHAAEWVRVSTIDVNSHWYDRSKVFVDGDVVTYWRRVVFRTPQRAKSGIATSAMYRERVDCHTHLHTTLGYLLYAKDQSVLENSHTPDATPEPIIPETLGDQFEKLMCALAPQMTSEQRAVQSSQPRTAGELRDEIDFLEARIRLLREQLDLLTHNSAPAPDDAGRAKPAAPAREPAAQ